MAGVENNTNRFAFSMEQNSPTQLAIKVSIQDGPAFQQSSKVCLSLRRLLFYVES